MWNQVVNTPDIAPQLSWQGLHILPGLNAVTGDEGVASLEIAIRCLGSRSADVVAPRKGPRRVVG